MVISEPTVSVPPRYRLIEEVGQGGMAVVYRAKDDSLKREVAIKVLHRHLASEPESKARLEREAQAVAKLHHDNILEIFDYSGADADSAYLVTEFIDGQTLKQFLGVFSIKHPEVATLIAVELCGALAHAHGMGIIHRDIKPENVMIRKDGLLKLMDFGIAQVLDLERMTVTGQLLGSPAYMAPELIEGKPLDVRTDVFSVGILLYQMTTGALPFSGKNPHEVLRRITEGRFPDPRGLNRLVGAGLARIMTRALAHAPDDRYSNMQALLLDLREQLDDAGLRSAREELAAYFQDPAAYERELPGRMTPSLMSTGEKHVAIHNSARAIECWTRVLAYAPDHPAVSAALRRWEGRGRRRKVLGIAALAGGLGALVLLVARFASGPGSGATSSTSPPPVPPAAPPPTGGPAVAGPVVAAPSLPPATPGSEGPGTRSKLGRPRGPAEHVQGRGAAAASGNPSDDGSPEAPATRTFALGPNPQNVDVYLDGERQFAYDTDHRTLTVAWNTGHKIEFRSPSDCCFVERIEIGPDRPLPPDNVIARKLRWKPARLVVTTHPVTADARVMVRDPARPGRGTVVTPGEEANIPFLPTDEAQKEIEVSVDSSLGVFAQRIWVRAGERKAVVVPFKTPAPETVTP
jgi:tRNA A-37 threonylcarbamoyl transferase component Bud32